MQKNFNNNFNNNLPFCYIIKEAPPPRGGGASGLPNGKVDATKKRKNLYLWPGSCESVI